jgi:hypothetical protein
MELTTLEHGHEAASTLSRRGSKRDTLKAALHGSHPAAKAAPQPPRDAAHSFGRCYVPFWHSPQITHT